MPRRPFIPPPEPAIRISGDDEVPGNDQDRGVDINIQFPDEYSPMPLPPIPNNGGDNQDGEGDNLMPLPPLPGFDPQDVIPPGYTRANQSATDKKRRITVSRNNLDPLSGLYFSKVKYGNIYGLKLATPSADPSLKILTRQPNFQWSLAPIEGIETPPTRTETARLMPFLEAIDPNVFMRGEHYKSLYRQGNPHVYINKAFEGSVPTYTSMPAQMLDAVLATAERIVGLFSVMNINGDPIPFNEDMKSMAVRLSFGFPQEDPQVASFFTQLIIRGATLPFHEGNFAQEIEDYRREVNNRVFETGDDITMLTICTEILMRIAMDPISRESEKQLNRYLVADSVRTICNPLVLVRALREQSSYSYKQRYVEIDTPYITTKRTHRFLSDVQQPFYVAKITSDYNFYARQYEELHGNSSVLELPNSYVQQSYINMESVQNRTEHD